MLLKTKLYLPALPPEHIPRTALLERLRGGLSRRLTLITAPAGFGKSTCIVELFAALERPRQRLSLERRDGEPARFWSHVGYALEKMFDGLGAAATATLRRSRIPPVESVLVAWLNELTALAQTGVLALDDYDLIDNPAIHRDLELFINQLPPSLHLIVACRRRPALPVGRWRGGGELVEVNERDLKFDQAETWAYLVQRLGDRISEAQVHELYRRSEGWPSALQLAAASLESRDRSVDELVREFRGSLRQVAEYLAEEVLAGLDPQRREQLMRLSILDAFCAPLCVAVTGEQRAQDLFDALESERLPIQRLDGDGRWLRFHRLFGDFLRRRLERLDPEGVGESHRRASRWFESEKQFERAFAHARQAGEIDRALALLARGARALVECGESLVLIREVERLGQPLAELDPELLVHLATAFYVANRTDRCRQALGDLERLRSKDLLSPEQIALTLVLQGAIARSRDGDLRRSVELFESALAELPEDDHGTRLWVAFQLGIAQLYAFELDAAATTFESCSRAGSGEPTATFGGLANLAQVRALQGRLRQSEELCLSGLETAPATPSPARSLLQRTLGAIHLARGEWQAAEAALDAAIRQDRLIGFDESVAWSALWQAELARATGDFRGFDESLAIVERLGARGSLAPVHRAWQRALRLHRQLDEGDTAGAVRLARKYPPTPGAPTMFDQVWRLARVRGLVAAGEPEAARRELGDQLAAARQQGRQGGEIELLVWSAWLEEVAGGRRGLDRLCDAVTSAREEGFVHPFFGPPASPMLRLFDRLLARTGLIGGTLDLARRLRRELHQRQVVQPRHSDSDTPALTTKERQVLALLADGRTNAEISVELGVAPSTVKTHLKNLYGKLGVRRRTQAVARARSAGLL